MHKRRFNWKKINKKTVGICAPNLIGNLPNWEKIKKIAKKYGLVVLEDSADTLGSTINGLSSGHFSDISIASYYGSHIINCAGNGGSLEKNSLLLYQLTKNYNKQDDISINYDSIGFKWPVKKPIINKRDKNALTLEQFLLINKNI